MRKLRVKQSFYLVLIFTLILMNFSPVLSTSVAATDDGETTEELFISEYIEGSSYNKAIEIYNGTGEEVDLSGYQLALYSNGANEPSQTMTLDGTLAHDDAYVIAHPNADEAVLEVADQTNGNVINFNGNDSIALQQNASNLDVIGIIGDDRNFAKDVTLVRNSSVIAPVSNYDEGQWTNYDKDTFAYLGDHTVDGVDPGEPGEPDPENPDLITIDEARQLNDRTAVTVEGIVTVNNDAISNGTQFTTYIQDDTGGINLFSFEQGELPDVNKGDLIKVVGQLDSYNGLKEIVPSSVEVLGTDQQLPEIQEVSLEALQNETTAESLEGELVRVNGFLSSIPESPAGGGYNISFIDGDFNGTTLRVMENALDVTQIAEEKWYDVTGIVSQYNSYQLIPTEQSDFQLAAEQPDPPSAAGEYETTVERVTDGDTIRIANPVLGETRVRFVNMDTPETYVAHNDDPARDEINENQKFHGDAATAYMNDLIQPGDEVIIRLGDTPTDDYGRLLAEVIRKEDGMNINLEMVEQGFASTYFIAPFNEEVYPEYQAAVKDAKDNGLGIWNPEKPLLELPFVFRANDDQKGFQRYVGNSDTKEYVVPDNWADVPVEKRVFFASPEEAESYGYTPAGDRVDENLQVQLLGFNDLHGKIDQEYELDPDGDGVSKMYGRIDYVTSAIKEREQDHPNSFVVHAGDMIGGSSPVSGLLQDEPTVEVMETIGFDVGSVGNHEFDEGTEELLRMVNGGEHPEGKGTPEYDGMDFPLLCANCVYKGSGDPMLSPYYIEKVDGVDIGFIGVTTEETANIVMPEGIQDIEFTDPTIAVNDAVAELQRQGVESIVILAHIPAEQDGDGATGEAADLARNVDDAVDVILAAHNHQVVDGMVDNKLIVQASEYGKAFADIDLEIDRKTGDIIQKEAEIVFVDQSKYTPDEDVTAILEKYQNQIGPILNDVIGYNATDLTGDYIVDGDHGLGNLLADAMNWAMDSDFAMMNGGGIRDDLLAGEVTWGDLYNIQPFGNTLMTVEVTGDDIYTILNEQISSQYGPDYSVSGLHYTWNSTLNEVVKVTLPDGTQIDRDEVYTLTVNNFMGTSEGPIKDLGQNPVAGPADIDATVDFVKSLNSNPDHPFTYTSEGRISETDKEPGDPGEQPEIEIEPKRDFGVATVYTREIKELDDGVRLTINIENGWKYRVLFLTKRQVDLLREKEVTLVVTNGSGSATFDMASYHKLFLFVCVKNNEM
ncbi:5'-nucleotidase C-terminal domain-containing protein [Virgibacillus sp. AGTR]|uniref:5'-nucleotidase C-terminal domain-containing protein n=1 Tax=Virgibacillus sp. AGTR TaxID=2812055 RepID=UPI0019664A74|nr:5'-nucleotidase C-terminal domain-containing protein [Virgibacillus sp. AGTR]MCC2251273.1 5'-nucleotidase C-terminal domain-containing protein [Virgibacillus sp. AGTR]QRZ19488.1 5'-nucleotidase C-terminal domain-containing protein [Virgibacillus sp. AGTR]